MLASTDRGSSYGRCPSIGHGLGVAAILAAYLYLAAVVIGCTAPAGQTTGKTVRIGYLETGAPGPTAAVVDGFRRGLRENGWEEGKNISVELRFAEGNEDRLPRLVQELLDMRVDVLVTATTQATRAARAATSTTPIVFAGLADPVGSGIVESNARPGGNATGTSLMTSHLHGKHLEILKETIPGLTRVAVLLNPSGPAGASAATLPDAARALGLEAVMLRVSSPGEFEPALDEALTDGAQALIALPDALFFNNRPFLIRLVAERSLPDIYWERSFARDGAFLAYGGNRSEAFRRAAAYVDKVLKGANPGALPVEDASQFDFAVNRNAQQRLNVVIPPSLAEAVTEWVD